MRDDMDMVPGGSAGGLFAGGASGAEIGADAGVAEALGGVASSVLVILAGFTPNWM